jgi:hypothetical protein
LDLPVVREGPFFSQLLKTISLKLAKIAAFCQFCRQRFHRGALLKHGIGGEALVYNNDLGGTCIQSSVTN